MKQFSIPVRYRSELISSIKKTRRESDKLKKDFSPTVLNFGPLEILLARHFGFCYGVENAMAAVKSQLFDLVQIEWNLLNQSVLDAVGEEAKRRKVKIALRSVFLQGVLTDKGEDLTGQLSGFRQKAKNLASEIGLTINALALRCALDHPMCPNVLVGPNRASQLQQICFDAQLPPIPSEVWNRIGELTVSDASLVDPRFWKIKNND
jgi:aryl-alcohol dehydrogenase-like predicted oxidoreductase